MRRAIALANRHSSFDQWVVSPLAAVFVLAMLCVLPGWTAVKAGRTEESNVPPRLRGVVGCLVAADFVRQYDLTYLGLKVGEFAWVRYRVGSIPGIGGTPGVFNVVVYSPDGRNGMLLFADPTANGGFSVFLNAYRLHRQGSKWSADYGNGGYVLYEAVGRFVTGLSRRPRYRVQLMPGGSGCTAA